MASAKDGKTNSAAAAAGTKSGGSGTAAAGKSAAGSASAAGAAAGGPSTTAQDKLDSSKLAEQALAQAQDVRGKAMLKAAEEKLSAFGWFGLVSTTSSKEEAVECFEKAAAAFKMAKEWDAAAAAYVRAGETCDKYLKSAENEAVNYYLQAAKAYKTSGSAEAARMFKLVVTLHMENNRFSAAAKIFKELAEIDEKDGRIADAMHAWEQAADCHFAEDQQSSGNAMLLKIAHYAALREDYKKAIELYERVAGANTAHSLMQYNVKEYLFKAILCHFALSSRSGDVSSVGDTNEKYKTLSTMWDGCREQKLIAGLVGAYEQANSQQFTDLLFGFDRISKLDSWTSTLLLTVKQNLKAQSAPIVATKSPSGNTAATTGGGSATGGTGGVVIGASAPVARPPNMQGATDTAAAGTGGDEPNMM